MRRVFWFERLAHPCFERSKLQSDDYRGGKTFMPSRLDSQIELYPVPHYTPRVQRWIDGNPR